MSKALVVDDSRAIRMILAGILGELGFEVCQAVNGRDALEKAVENGDLAVCLVDWNMPEMNGLEFVKAIRRHDRLAQVPVMMVTTETEMSQVMSALDAGANEYVMKPFTKDMIQEKLRLLGLDPREATF